MPRVGNATLLSRHLIVKMQVLAGGEAAVALLRGACHKSQNASLSPPREKTQNKNKQPTYRHNKNPV